MAKKKVVLTVKSRGFKPGDVVEVESSQADALVRDGLAREPEKAAKKTDS